MEHNKLLQQIIEGALNVAQEAEVYWLTHLNQPVLFEANHLKSIDQRERSGVALRVIKDGRIGLSSTTNLEDIQGLIDAALELAHFGPESKFDFPDPQDYPEVKVYDQNTADLSVEHMVNTGQNLIDQVCALDKDLLCESRVDRELATMHLLNSRGTDVSYTHTTFSVSIEATLIRDTDMLFLWEGESSCSPMLEISGLVSSLGKKLQHAKKVVDAPMGELPVIFTPKGVAGALLGPLLAGFSGKAVFQGTSPLADKLGQELLDKTLTLWDDPTLPFIPGSRKVDDEGMPAQKIPLIKDGVISNFLYDLQTAGQAGKISTGSAHRGLNSLPEPGSSVLMLATGDVTFDDMVSDLNDGIIVDGLLGAGQSNILGGAFNANVLLGFRVEHGKITGRVKNTLVSGNVYNLLKNIRGIGKEAQRVGGSMKLPPLYCNSVSIATKE